MAEGRELVTQKTSVQCSRCARCRDNAGVASSRPDPQISPDDLPEQDTLRRLVVRGQKVTLLFSAQVTWSQARKADDALRLRDRLEALVAEYRELAHRLAMLFRLHIEPAYERGERYPNPLEVDGETWSWHHHDAHCLFADQDSDTEIEVNTYRPNEIDPHFLFAIRRIHRSLQRHPHCLSGRYPRHGPDVGTRRHPPGPTAPGRRWMTTREASRPDPPGIAVHQWREIELEQLPELAPVKA